MSVQIPEEQIELKDSILEGMLDYMEGDEDEDEGFDPGYTKSHVEKCGAILDAFLSSVFSPSAKGSSDAIMASVKTAVLALNDLNDECDGSLIETGQREEICELIISSATRAGLESEEYDITEEWREW